uniref:Uncharacterized protein n=1 Tax=Phytophthora ramorum TaxID=164328 RepID=H3HC52_PHYRM
MATPGANDVATNVELHEEEQTVAEQEKTIEEHVKEEANTTVEDQAAEVDDSVAATLGSSVDGDSVKTEDFAGEEAFEEESSKVGEVDLAALAAEEDEAAEEAPREAGREEAESNVEAAEEEATLDVSSAVSEMDYSVAATLGSSVDADSVFSLDDMRDSSSDVAETTGGSESNFNTEESNITAQGAESGAGAVSAEPTAVESEEVSTVSDVQVDKEETTTEETTQEAVTATVETTETHESVLSVAETTLKGSEVEISDEVSIATVEEPKEAAPANQDGEAEEPEHEADDAAPETSEQKPKKKLPSLISHFADKVTAKTGAHRTDSAAKLELNPPSPVRELVHHLEVHEEKSPQTHRTPSAAKLDLSGASPVKHAVHHLETHHEDDDPLGNLKIRTKREFFSKERSISVSGEKKKYNDLMAQRAKDEAEAKEMLKSPAKKQSPGPKKSSAMSSVRNMASRFEKKAEQSLDNLSFRTVRSFFPTEKSVHVGAEKQKYEAVEKEKEKQAAKEAEEKLAKRVAAEEEQKLKETGTSDDTATASTETTEPATEESVAQETASLPDVLRTPTKDGAAATAKLAQTPEPYRRHTLADAESPGVRGMAQRFETKRTQSVVTRTVDTFFAPDASVRVSAEKEKYEALEKQVKTAAPTVRTVDTFFAADASVRVSAEKEKYEAMEKQVQTAAPTVRTVDTFFAPDASVRVSAEKEKYEAMEKQVQTAAPAVRTVDTFFAPDASVRVSAEKEKYEAMEKQVQTAAPAVRTVDTFFAADASVRVSAEKEKYEALEKQMLSAAPAVRTVDTFFVPESEVSVRVAAEKSKLEALEKQKQKELEAREAIERQKSERAKMAAAALLEKTAVEMEQSNKVEESEEVTEEIKSNEEVSTTEEEKGPEKANDMQEIKEAVDVFTKEVKAAEEVTPTTEAVKEVEDVKVVEEVTEIEQVKELKETEVAEEAKASEETLTAEEVQETEEVQTSEELKETEEVITEMTTTKDVEKAGTEVTTTEDAKQVKAIEAVKEAEEVTTTEVVENAEVQVATTEKTEETEVVEEVKESEVVTVDEVKGHEEVEAREEVVETDKVEATEVDSETEDAQEPQEVTITEEVKETVEIKGDEEVTTTETVKVVEEVTTTEEAAVGEEVKVSDAASVTEVVKETEQVTTTEEVTETDVVQVVEEVKVVEKTQVVEEVKKTEEENTTAVIEQNDTAIMEESVPVSVREVTFADVVSTIQHAQWLSLPASASPALARLHTVLSEHDPLTAFALYPSGPPSPSSQDGAAEEDLPLPHIPTSEPPAPTDSAPERQAGFGPCKSEIPHHYSKASAMQASLGDKYAFLEPWCAVLRGRLTSEGRFSDHSALGEYWYVAVRPPPSLMAILNREASDVRVLREALELLSLVAIVDNEAWKFLLLQCCDLALDDDDTLDGVFEPRFLLRFDAEHLRYSAFFLPRPALHRNNTAEDGTRTSAGFQDALFTILAFHRAAGGRQETVDRWRKIPYALQFTDFWHLGQPVLSAHLRALLVTLDDIRRHNEWLAGEREAQRRALTLDEDGNESLGPLAYSEDDGAADGHYFAYELESVQMCLGTIQVSRDLPNVFLTTLSMPSLAISELQLSLEQDPQTGYFRPGEVHPRALAAHYRCGMLFNTIFCGRSITTRPNDQPRTVRRSSIESVVIPLFGMDDQTFSGLCSSLAEATEVRKLTINGVFRPLTPAQRTWRWQWLTYALFSDASRSSIEEINLMGVQLSNTDVDAIAQVLAANVPEPGQATDAAEAAYAEAGNTVEYVYIPKGTSVRNKESIASPNDSTSLETVDDFMFRLLQHDDNSDWVNVLVPGREQEMPVLVRLLGLVGRSLQRLSIQTTGSAALDVQAILKASPKLDQLFLDSVQLDLAAFMLQMENGSAKIRCFGLAYYNAPAEVITRFAKKLADPHSALANGIRELCLGADNEEFPMTDESVQAFLGVLKTNAKLVYLDLLVLPALFDRYAAAFRQHHQELLSVEKDKLPLRCRLAFLSVVRGHSTPVSDTLLHLDNNLLQIIFSFAAVSAKRTVCIRCDH